MFITVELLQSRNACATQLNLFAAMFPDGVEATEALCEQYAHRFDFLWVASKLLTAECWGRFRAQCLALTAKYWEQRKPMEGAFRSQLRPSDGAYWEQRKLLDAKYREQDKPIDATYHVELKLIDEVYWAQRKLIEGAYRELRKPFEVVHIVEVAKLFARVSSTQRG